MNIRYLGCTKKTSLSTSKDLIYSDASYWAVSAVAYLKTTDLNDGHHLGFIMGKAKLAKPAGNSIPRLELCGAVLATEIGQFVSHQLHLQPSDINYFSDSKVILGCTRNKTRRFHTYVSKRVSLIQQFTSVEQWNYVPSNLNPADDATRKSWVAILRVINAWIQGPTYILHDNKLLDESKDDFPLIEPEIDKEIHQCKHSNQQLRSKTHT
ncbi:unnamed protein product [Mytilus coruscus]|uniref:RNase H type-1 domain-containing protein n=1 Tax=Mytilus coruscus TaxID=42192 RepID=A0A6J8BM86_MYTCO|nr:unnamed protein product [Mytilus coruscus]